jgi:hypothetical protein
MNTYTQKLEQIILEIQESSPNETVGTTEYQLWLEFLRQIHPKSKLLQEVNMKGSIIKENDFDKDIKCYSDIREIMMLAENKKYPTWFIQPKFEEPTMLLEYDQGALKNDPGNLKDIPKSVPGFTGSISGYSAPEKLLFFAGDITTQMNFLEKMKLLKNAGFETLEHVLFPTDKLPTISSNKLEASLQNYMSTIQEGVKVEGVIIISDVPLFTVDNPFSSTRIVFRPKQVINS